MDIDIEFVFVDWPPIESKSEINSGGHIRRYYAWKSLNKMISKVIPFKKKNGSINLKAIQCLFKKNSKIWVEYGCGRLTHLIIIFISFIRFKKVILNIHDFVIQEKYLDQEAPFFKRIQLQIIEKILLQRAEFIILPCPGLLEYFIPRKGQKILIMPPGIGEDELLPLPKENNRKNIALYFGSMQRNGMIPRIIEIFSNLNDWELHLVGLKEGQEIDATKNVKYLGFVSHDKIEDILIGADVVLIPSFKNEYLNIAMNMKIGYALRSCRPVIATKLDGISQYVSIIGLEENVVYIEDWNLENMRETLKKAQSININPELTLEKLKSTVWEPRFERTIEIVFSQSNSSTPQIEWI